MKNNNHYFVVIWKGCLFIASVCLGVRKEEWEKTVLDRQGGHLKSNIGNYLLNKAIVGKEAMPGATASKNKTKQANNNTFCILPEFKMQAGTRQYHKVENSLY